ncbi:MAG TPA: DNA starvation/stationary phase protection protein Dps [Anaeromyxobacter sp.]|nr:DNA starvation/stationary phase protection protein Dps [Anaeromyxobacter sp.]
MFSSPNPLAQDARSRIAEALAATLADGLDLHSQIKVAHWNVKGLHFAALHPLYETFATTLAGFNDEVAERAVTLGALVRGTARHVAQASRIPEYPDSAVRDLDTVRHLSERIEAYLAGVRKARDVADAGKDQDTVELLTGVVNEFEKNAWFLRASLEK